MAPSKSQKVVPRLKNYHVSEETGFILPEPLVALPEYFEPWNKLNRDLSDLLKTHKLRAAVDQMPELDDSSLSGYRQLRLAYTILSFISNGYIWQEGDENTPKVLPRQLAIPWYSISKRLDMKPCVCLTTMVLSNCTRLDFAKPLALGNMKMICKISDEEPYQWFFNVVSQSELDSVVGIKALVTAMDAVLENDIENVCNSLEVVASTVRTLKTTMARMHERLPGDYFLPKIDPFLSGYGGKGAKFPEGITFEGACDTPITVSACVFKFIHYLQHACDRRLEEYTLHGLKAVRGSAAQSSSFQCFDVGLGIDHGDAQKYLNELRTYMPPAHAEFIRALAQGPSIKGYAASSGDERLKKLYADCVSAIRDLRSYHIQVVTKYVVVPAGQKGGDLSEAPVATGLIPFLKSVRDTTASI